METQAQNQKIYCWTPLNEYFFSRKKLINKTALKQLRKSWLFLIVYKVWKVIFFLKPHKDWKYNESDLRVQMYNSRYKI
jgi:hypothetical protein